MDLFNILSGLGTPPTVIAAMNAQLENFPFRFFYNIYFALVTLPIAFIAWGLFSASKQALRMPRFMKWWIGGAVLLVVFAVFLFISFVLTFVIETLLGIETRGRLIIQASWVTLPILTSWVILPILTYFVASWAYRQFDLREEAPAE